VSHELDIAGLLAASPELAAMGPAVDISDIADGNINRVIRITCAHGSVVVKQGLPFIRIDPSWELSPTRTVFEGRAYLEWNTFAPGMAPHVYVLDEAGYVLAMEDLGELTSWRLELLDGRVQPEAAAAIGAFVASVAFHTSSLGLAAPEPRGPRGDCANPVMTALMDDVAFLEPYVIHPHNGFPEQARETVYSLRRDRPLRLAVGEMRACYLSRCEALIHGDLHTGSVMVGKHGVRLIDAEFCRYGPIAWDVGQLIGNFLIAQARMLVLGDHRLAAEIAALPRSFWDAFECEFRRVWPERRAGVPDEVLGGWLDSILEDSVRFAGCEMMRQVIGSGRVEDIETLPGEERGAVAVALLHAGRRLALERQLGISDAVRATQEAVSGDAGE
jgi:5-methylthioribose kinase